VRQVVDFRGEIGFCGQGERICGGAEYRRPEGPGQAREGAERGRVVGGWFVGVSWVAGGRRAPHTVASPSAQP
jgi:hypothetical protein